MNTSAALQLKEEFFELIIVLSPRFNLQCIATLNIPVHFLGGILFSVLFLISYVFLNSSKISSLDISGKNYI